MAQILEAGLNFNNQRRKYMNDSDKGRLASNTNRAKSDLPGEPPQPTNPVAHRNRRHHVSLIILILLPAIVVIVYLLRPALAQRYEGIGVALCVVACGLFLVRRVIRLMKAEDKWQEEHPDGNEALNLPPEPNAARQETNRTPSPPEAGQNLK
jgi:hypothetical protein